MGGREPAEVEQALHELARKEFVRPTRTSSMAGEAEYAFSHLLVRDVCYSQIPRAARAVKHRAAAAWIEREAEDRIGDMAEVLAHHYVAALELARAAGDGAQAEELVDPARRFLAFAGERALGLNTPLAEARLTQALELSPLEDPERPELLLRWADAAVEAGRPRDAATAIEQALASFRDRSEREAEARALIRLSRVAALIGEPGFLAQAAEAVRLLEAEGPGPGLVEAYESLAAAHFLAGAHVEAVAVGERALELAARLELPVPTQALSVRGNGRAALGDPAGLVEMEQALALLRDAGAGRAAAAQQNNLAIARYPLEGPARSLAAFEEGISFSEQRGLAGSARWMKLDCPGLLVELGRPNEALDLAASLADALEGSGNKQELIWVRAVELGTRLARGEPAPTEADWLVESVRQVGQPAALVEALAAAAVARFEAGAHEDARSLIAELEETPGSRETVYYARQLPAMLRVALQDADRALAERLMHGLDRRYPLNDHVLCAARAQLAEHAGEHAHAATLYAEAAARWQEFGNVPERAHALLGQGRCLLAIGEPGAEQPLREAGDLFAAMGYKPALAETEALLEQTAAARTP